MKINPKKLSLQEKMSCVFILANMLVFLVTLLLFTGINSMSREIDMVYEDNMHLNELSDALTSVQDSMTDYLNAKTSDSLEEFYRNEQTYTEMVEELNDEIAGTAFMRMERSIRYMSQEYLDVVGQTIEAKRGRNVEKYRVRYENATQMYGYIDTYSMVYTNLIAVITHELQLEKQRRSNLELEVADLRSELETMRDNLSGNTN